ncbi:MAG TPA: DUF3237 family protein [Candidatus Saccharimonadales bacterium]|jgi:hypothetical protein|nr:DUF3237 family protein [Candidatus Saccharimonadales bacterium]
MPFSKKTQHCARRVIVILTLLSLPCPLAFGQASTNHAKTGKSVTPTLPPENQDTLFDADLQARSDQPQAVSSEGREGKLIDSGDGNVRGPRIRGRLRWSNFEKVGDRLCEMNLAGIIETEDGAQIKFESKGFALLTKPPTWETAGTMRFTTTDKRYAWLNGLLANWHGNYDPGKSHGTLHASATPSGNMGLSHENR